MFTPRSKAFKDQIRLDELARWIITYHSYSTVSEKNLVALDGKKTKFQKSAGWLYRLSPCFVTGKNLFETLMLNTVLVGDKGAEPQKPYWEYNQQDYIEHRLQMKQPKNTAEAYTVWSRMLHIDLDAYGKPILYSASFPQLETKEAYSEQMTTWRFNQKQGGMTPDLKREANIEEPMWLDWNEFTDENTDNTHALGIMEWLKLIYQQDWISKNATVNLTTINLIDNGNVTSKLPIRELYGRISPKLWMLSDESWFKTIGLIVDATAKVAGSAWKLAQEVSNLKGLQAQSNAIAQKTKNKFWRDLADSMISFDDWLEEIEYSDDRVEVARNWFTITAKTYDSIRAEICSDPSPREIKGDNDQNIFTINNHYRGSVQRTIVNALTEIKKIS
ncbi:hypothetical protein CEE91_11195 [Lactobacillus crispatus]|uniref:type I-E CRISPR-associated protein Cse1/CasA n=1 Tax=Lactobacillus crispatus TaxID=47770 RepID=UPI00106130F8|nr:type I-E CRISPR-associated protein Cse1/CasA [Lactobacillus crispatus]TDM82693.1 hypothetical protein CEE93_12005 [Lactobacillus crispatus]TDM90326.1 hypothetical protein CEE91_11195 [Lactobacillus crispatus]